jgi:integrase
VWVARILMPSGGRRPVPMPGIGQHEVERAHHKARDVAQGALDGGFVPVEALETCGDYFGRWVKARAASGVRTTYDDKGRWKKWLAPHLSHKPVAGVTTRDLEHLVAALDGHVRAGQLAWKTAIHVWGTCTKMFDDAVRSKNLDLRARPDNPARDVRGPDRGHTKAGAFLFPSELDTLLRAPRVPLARKRLYALAVYIGARAGELRALEWDDVSEEAGYVHVHRSLDRRTKALKATKTGVTRRVPIEPALLPLLEVMREESGGKGRLVSAPTWDMAEILRADLKEAGVTRADIEADDATRRPLDFHDLRHTYGTWRAIRGDDLTKISRAMGHSTTAMTEKYVNEAEAFGMIGKPFAPLPDLRADLWPNTVRNGSQGRVTVWPLRGLNACPAGPDLPPSEVASTEIQAESAIDGVQRAPAIVDTREQTISDLESALRQAIAAATIAGDDTRADQLRAMLPKPAPVVRLVSR